MLTTRRRVGPLIPFDWMDLSWFPFTEPVIRIEDELDGHRYTVRAELPGTDPAKDVDITYVDGVLQLTVTRTAQQRDKGHSEFRYGTFHRTLPLPAGAKAETLAAVYHGGVLEITVEIDETRLAGKHIPIALGNGKTARKTG
jgi:HSP20 family protein